MAGGRSFWINRKLRPWRDVEEKSPLTHEDWRTARARLVSFRPLYAALFEELREAGGEVVSPLIETDGFAAALGFASEAGGRVFIKGDHALPVGGSVKTRGALYEVVSLAEKLARRGGVLAPGEPPEAMLSEACRAFFARHAIVAGSTGNLGMGIGAAARALGFRAVIHMSREASAWKKERLNKLGAEIFEHESDYTSAVEAARADADASTTSFFIDDEASTELFLGYSTAAEEVERQLRERDVAVDRDHPLFVYIPCGVGGAPGGVSFGLKQVFGDDVHCFFAEPAASACVFLQLSTGSADPVSVYDYGLDNRTIADGLAVSKASQLTTALIAPLVSGVFTVLDEDLYRALFLAKEKAEIKAEPSAFAGALGPCLLTQTQQGRAYLAAYGLEKSLPQATHLIWTTGGLYQPADLWRAQYERGAELNAGLSRQTPWSET